MTGAIQSARPGPRPQGVADLYLRCRPAPRGLGVIEVSTAGLVFDLASLTLSVYDLYRAITENREATSQARALLESQCGQVLNLARQSHELATVTEAFKVLRVVKVLNVACLGLSAAAALFDAIMAVRSRAEALRAEEAARSGALFDDALRTSLSEHDSVRVDLGHELRSAATHAQERATTARLALPAPTQTMPCNNLPDAGPRPLPMDAMSGHSSQSVRQLRRKLLQQHKQENNKNHAE